MLYICVNGEKGRERRERGEAFEGSIWVRFTRVMRCVACGTSSHIDITILLVNVALTQPITPMPPCHPPPPFRTC